jgi:hypothetical protein
MGKKAAVVRGIPFEDLEALRSMIIPNEPDQMSSALKNELYAIRQFRALQINTVLTRIPPDTLTYRKV